jgi:apolipoprotein N-acyltransferase
MAGIHSDRGAEMYHAGPAVLASHDLNCIKLNAWFNSMRTLLILHNMSYDRVVVQIKFIDRLRSIYGQSSAWKVGMFSGFTYLLLNYQQSVFLRNWPDELFICLSSCLTDLMNSLFDICLSSLLFLSRHLLLGWVPAILLMFLFFCYSLRRLKKGYDKK